MDTKEDGKACCDKSKCCGGKALAAIGLLALGGVGGFFAGRACKTHCDLKASTEVSAPAATPAPAAKPAK